MSKMNLKIIEVNEVDNDKDKFILNKKKSIYNNLNISKKKKFNIYKYFCILLQIKIHSKIIVLIILFFYFLYFTIIIIKIPQTILQQNKLIFNNNLNNVYQKLSIIIEDMKNYLLKEVISNNKINNVIYEDNIDFSNYSSDIKAIAIYLPTFYDLNNKKKIINKFKNSWKSIQNSIPLFNEHYQPRKPLNKIEYLGYYDLRSIEVIKKQIQIAKNHGIFGFGIYYYWQSGISLFDKPLKLIFTNDEIDFKFLLM